MNVYCIIPRRRTIGAHNEPHHTRAPHHRRALEGLSSALHQLTSPRSTHAPFADPPNDMPFAQSAQLEREWQFHQVRDMVFQVEYQVAKIF